MTLTQQNYHGQEANKAYMSVSQFKSFTDCPAKAKAVIDGQWIDDINPAFQLGSYVDAGLLTPDQLAADMEANNDMYYTRQGKPRAFVEQGNEMIERCKQDKKFMAALYPGDHQVIVTFKLYGVAWKVMFDSVDPDRSLLADLKTSRSITEETWSDEHKQRVPFYEAYNYWLQFAVYRMAYKSKYRKLPNVCLLPVVSKESPPDIEVFSFENKYRFKKELDKVKAELPRIMAYKSGKAEPPRCGRCAYCRSTKQIGSIIPAQSLATQTISYEDFVAA